MRRSYEGNEALANALMPEALHAFTRTQQANAGKSGQWRVPLSAGECIVTLGNAIDGIHIIPAPAEDEDLAKVPQLHSGATLDGSKFYALNDGRIVLDAFSQTSAEMEEYNRKNALILSLDLPVAPHLSMPTRLDDQLKLDTQYTVQQASKYTGKMCKLIQVILAYGIPRKEEVLSKIMLAYALANPSVILKNPSYIFSKENRQGVQNQFNFEYGRTHGLYERVITKSDGSTETLRWVIEISTSDGVRAMPLQLEPITTTPQFKAYIAGVCEKDGHKKFYDNIKTILDEFGGFPTNEGFLTKRKDKIVTLISPAKMTRYTEGKGVNAEVGWAFNDSGSAANNVCLEEKGETKDWYMAHHCQISITYNEETEALSASFTVLESGSMPLGKGKLKVGDSVLDACVSFNISQNRFGDFSTRPKATNTAVHVFYKGSKLIVLRYTDGHTEDPGVRTETAGDPTDSFSSYTTETWSGTTGVIGGFYYDGHDGRLAYISNHTKIEVAREFGGESARTISFNPAIDAPEYFSRAFWQSEVRTTTIETGQTTWNNCAFIPLGDRSAFYIVNFTQQARVNKRVEPFIRTVGDPYSYVLRDTYIWNFDFGYACGKKYPFTWAGVTLSGLVNVIWDRSGASGQYQLDHYCQYYVTAPYGYVGGGPYGWSQSLQDSLDKWTAATGKSEWFDIGAEPHTSSTACDLTVPEQSWKIEGGGCQLLVHFCSMGYVGAVFNRVGSYLQIYRDYNYWFDPSPNANGNFQTMWARRNCFGKANFQLWSTDVNDSELATDGGYPLPNDNFPTFIGVVDDLVAW